MIKKYAGVKGEHFVISGESPTTDCSFAVSLGMNPSLSTATRVDSIRTHCACQHISSSSSQKDNVLLCIIKCYCQEQICFPRVNLLDGIDFSELMPTEGVATGLRFSCVLHGLVAQRTGLTDSACKPLVVLSSSSSQAFCSQPIKFARASPHFQINK